MTATDTAAAELREYESIVILRPTVDTAEATRVNTKVGEVVAGFNGKLTKLDNWGRRKLAYPMQKCSRGLFVYVQFVAECGVVAELERNLRITDSVLRYQTSMLRKNVLLEGLEIEAEDVDFGEVEVVEQEPEMALEQRLRLAPAADRRSSYGDRSAPSAEKPAADAAAPAADAAAPAADAAAPAADAAAPAADAAAPAAEAAEAPAEAAPAAEGGEA